MFNLFTQPVISNTLVKREYLDQIVRWHTTSNNINKSSGCILRNNPLQNWYSNQCFLSIDKHLTIETSANESTRSQTKKIFISEELTKYRIVFRNHWKSDFKMPEVEKEEEPGRKIILKLKET